jgi:putative copper resistance protein D
MLVDVVSVIVRALSFIAILQAAGMTIFLPVLGSALAAQTQRALRQLTRRSALIALPLLLLHFVLEPARMGGDFAAVADSQLQVMALHSPMATALAWKLAGMFLIAVGTIWSWKRGKELALLGAAVALVGFTQTGHTATHSAHLILQCLLWMHLAIGAFWFGALLPLNRIVRNEPAPMAAAIIQRFSFIAGWLVPMLAVAGIAMAWLLLGSVSALATAYGVLLLGKLLLFAVLMVLAALNRWRHGPALASQRNGAANAFRFTVLVEYFLLLGVLLATATLTTLFSPES